MLPVGCEGGLIGLTVGVVRRGDIRYGRVEGDRFVCGDGTGLIRPRQDESTTGQIACGDQWYGTRWE